LTNGFHMTPRLGRLLNVNDLTVHYHEAGEGRPVLLVHGWSSLGEEIFPAFSSELLGVRLIAVDRPGYGWSDPLPLSEAGAAGQAAWLCAFLAKLDLTDVLLVAHSLGAATALCLAARQDPRVTGLVLLAPFCRPTPHAAMPLLHVATAPIIGPVLREAVLPLIAPLVGPGILAAALRPNAVPDYLSSFPFVHAGRPEAVRTMASELLAFNAVMGDVEPLLGGVSLPTAIIFGEADEIAAPDWHIGWLQTHLPDADIVSLPGVGHAPHHADTDRVMRTVRSLLGA
jgi:pimeloyl-ACP methyl ester carboxylesterase